jgi:2-iminobutanoate/2-iminopropanoate deaminase
MSKPVAPYTPAVRAGDWLVISGQLGMRDGQLAGPDLESQTRQALANLKGLVEANGARIDQVAKCMVFLTDMNDFAEMNTYYVEAFGDHRPARSCIGVAALPMGGRVEIEAWVFVG